MARYNALAVVTAGTPINVAKLLIGYNPAANERSTPPVPSSGVYASRIFIQMAIGGSGYGIVFDGVPLGVTPADGNNWEITAQLAPASSTGPGSSYSDTSPYGIGLPQIDLRKLWIDGSNSGDGIRVSAYIVD